MHRHVHDAAALRAQLGPVRAVRIDVPREVAVVSRIGIDQAADGAVLVGDLRLDAAPAGAVAREHDLALHADAELFQPLEIRGHAVIHVHDLTGDITVTRVGVVERRLIAGVRVLGQHRFFDLERVPHRRDQLHAGLERPRHHRFELFDAGVEAERLELRQRPVGHLLRRRLAGDVRLARHRLHVFLQPRRVGDLSILLFTLPLRGDRVVGKAAQTAATARAAARVRAWQR